MTIISRGKTILIADGNPGDVRLFREALNEIGANHEIVVAKSGDAALEFLDARQIGDAARPPDIVFLTLGLPKMGTLRVLEKIKNDPQRRALPVIVFYNASTPGEIAEAARLGADSCVYRPESFDELCALLAELNRLWLTSPAPANDRPQPATQN